MIQIVDDPQDDALEKFEEEFCGDCRHCDGCEFYPCQDLKDGIKSIEREKFHDS
jgi:hypothetical protein